MSSLSEQKVCPKCQGPIPREAPQGLCPKCLLAQAFIATENDHPARTKEEPPTVADLAKAFPQLEILELIGRGGMGFVFKTRQPNLDRFVALKILPQSLSGDPTFAARFSREGRVLAKLNHPNIVTIHDFGQAGGFCFLLMEYVDGVNLRQAMKLGRFTPSQALSVVPKICEALEFAHQEGILHRDIKPENILLDTKGRIKIADFGIAKILGSRTGDEAPAVSEPVQKEGLTGVVGTPNYMAPEQIQNPQDVDQRADIYSLGVVFYEMLTGELPLGRFAPPSEKSGADPRLDAVILKTLEKERDRRTPSAAQVKTLVETATQEFPPVIPPLPIEDPDRSPVKSGSRWCFSLGLSVGIAIFLLSLFSTILQTFIMPKSFVGIARIKVSLDVNERNPRLRLNDEVQYVTASPVLWEAAQALDLDTKWAKRFGAETALKQDEVVQLMRRWMKVHIKPESSILEIQCYSEEPQEAAANANAVAAALVKARSGREGLQLLDPAMVPNAPVRPDILVNISFGVLIGIVLGGLAGGVVYFLARLFARKTSHVQGVAAAGRTPDSMASQSKAAKAGSPESGARIRRGRMVGLSVFFLTLFIAIVVSYLIPESFLSVAKVSTRVTPADGDASNFLNNEAEFIRSSKVLWEVAQANRLETVWAERYGNGGTLGQDQIIQIMRWSTGVKPVPGSTVISIGFYSPLREESARMANSIAAAYLKSKSDKEGFQLIDEGSVPWRPARPNRPLNITIGAVLGILVGIAAGLIAGVWSRPGPSKNPSASETVSRGKGVISASPAAVRVTLSPSTRRVCMRRGAIAAALIFLLTVFFAATLTFLQPKLYRGIANIKGAHAVDYVLPSLPKGAQIISPLDSSKSASSWTARIVPTDDSLWEAAKALDLESRWTLRYGNGGKLGREQIVAVMRQSLQVNIEDRFRRVSISYYSPVPEESASVANALAEVFLKSTSVQDRQKMLQRAEVPTHPDRPDVSLNLLLGGLMGVLFGGVAGCVVTGLSLLGARRLTTLASGDMGQADAPPGKRGGLWLLCAPFKSELGIRIGSHLNAEEVRHSARIGAFYGLSFAVAIFGTMLAFLLASHSRQWGVAPAVFVLGLVGVIVCQQIELRFLASTDWAKGQGITVELIRSNSRVRLAIPLFLLFCGIVCLGIWILFQAFSVASVQNPPGLTEPMAREVVSTPAGQGSNTTPVPTLEQNQKPR